jgi:hypothetical protein
LRSLLDARSIRFDPLSNTWSWQTDDATATGAAGDLSSFMVAKLENLPLQSRRLLRHMACIGRKADMHLLTVDEDPIATVQHEAMVLPTGGLQPWMAMSARLRTTACSRRPMPSRLPHRRPASTHALLRCCWPGCQGHRQSSV